MTVQPDPRYAHSADSGGGTPNPDDEVTTRDRSGAEHANTRRTTAGVEERPAADARPHGAARVEHAPPEEAFETLHNPTA